MSKELNHLAAILHVYAWVWILWSKKKKFFVIIFQKENGNTFTLFIISIVKSLQKEQNSTNILLWPPICRNKSAITPKWVNSLDTNSRVNLYSLALSLHSRPVHKRIFGILAAQPTQNGHFSCLHSFKIVWPMKPSRAKISFICWYLYCIPSNFSWHVFNQGVWYGLPVVRSSVFGEW